ncbi:MAG: glycerate kinase [Bryobacteraceae bacterium]
MDSNLRHHAEAIYTAALAAADPSQAVSRFVRLQDGLLQVGERSYPVASFRDIYVIGAGKASAPMAQTIEQLLGDRITSGLINVKDGHLAPLSRIQINESSHPVPDARGVEGAHRISQLARGAGREDLVICLISGGASALTPYPAPPITLEQKQTVTTLLLQSGADIHEINAIRKHISLFKGGRLAALAAPATVISLLLSDVVGDNIDVIGSGPTAPDSSTFVLALAILDKYGLRNAVPAPVLDRLEAGAAGRIEETPKPGDPIFDRVQNLVVGSNKLAVEAAAEKATSLGYRCQVLTQGADGEARDSARFHASVATRMQPPACLLSGGETTVTIRGSGLGGRNQEFALAAAIAIDGKPNTVVVSFGTDGSDGPTDAAGAIAAGDTVARASALGLDPTAYLDNNDSYHFFEPLHDLIKTGPTNTNVMDIRFVLVGDNQ